MTFCAKHQKNCFLHVTRKSLLCQLLTLVRKLHVLLLIAATKNCIIYDYPCRCIFGSRFHRQLAGRISGIGTYPEEWSDGVWGVDRKHCNFPNFVWNSQAISGWWCKLMNLSGSDTMHWSNISMPSNYSSARFPLMQKLNLFRLVHV